MHCSHTWANYLENCPNKYDKVDDSKYSCERTCKNFHNIDRLTNKLNNIFSPIFVMIVQIHQLLFQLRV